MDSPLLMKVKTVILRQQCIKIVLSDHNGTSTGIQTQLLWQNTCFQEEIGYDLPLLGGVAERLNAPVLKTGVG